MIKQALHFYESERHSVKLSVADFKYEDDYDEKPEAELIDKVLTLFLTKQTKFQIDYKRDGLTIDWCNRVFFTVNDFYAEICKQYTEIPYDIVKMTSTITEFFNCSYTEFYRMLIATAKTMLITALSKTHENELRAVLKKKAKREVAKTGVVVSKLPIFE